MESKKSSNLLKSKFKRDVRIKDSRQLITIPAPNGPTDLRDVLNILEDSNIELLHISLTQPTLDEVFLSFTEKEAKK